MCGGRNFKACLIIAFLLGIGCTAASGRTIYVDDDEPADFNTIQAAIDDSNDGDTIIVADGIYTGEGNRDIDFSHGLPEGQTRAITVRSANGPENCIIDCNGTESDRHRGFRFASGEDANSVIDGFTIINGFAPFESMLPPLGISYAPGGAIYCWQVSNPTIYNCIISGNSADDCNISNGGFGGGISCTANSGVAISNCTITGNWANSYGGGIDCYGSNTTISNTILWGNNDSGGEDESAQLDVYIPPVVNYSCIQGWTGTFGGIGNIGADPFFADANNDDYHLKSQAGRWDANEGQWTKDEVASPCIDAGDPKSPIGSEPFPNGGIINMGAYGGTAEASKSYFGEPVCETIVAGDINGDCEVNFLDFQIMALHWLEER